ncbi:MAG: xylulokinase, partial [Actinobacteria bacterium]|nr:xylulokinase [Actinomycetota bacterium]
DAAGATVASASAHYPLATPHPGWSEQDPEHWVRAAVEATRAAIARAEVAGHRDAGRRIAAIGFSGQMHGAVLVDRTNVPLRPCILWNDSRSAPECEELDARIGTADILARTGNRLLPGFTAPKVRWVQRHEPERWAATDCVLLPKDFLRLRLGSVRATDAADASGTLYFDVANRRWSEPMLRDLGMTLHQVPECHESPDIVDRLGRDMADAMGLAAGIPLVAGAGDQAAAAVGAGIASPGRVAATLGTSGVLFAACDRFRASPDGALHAFCHALPGRWHLMSVMLSAGGSLQWFLETMARDAAARAKAEGCSVHQLLDREAAGVPLGCDGVTFVPTLSGERCPIPNPTARGSFHGLSPSTTQAHLARAVLEGVAASMAL